MGLRVSVAVLGMALITVGEGLKPPYPFADVIGAAPWFFDAAFMSAGFAVMMWMIWPDFRPLYLTATLLTIAVVATSVVTFVFLAPSQVGAAGWTVALIAVAELFPRLAEDFGAAGRRRPLRGVPWNR